MASALLVTLAQAKAHLKITTPDGHPGDADIQDKLDAAETLIRKYLKASDDPTWTAETVPAIIPQTILLYLGREDIDRGDGKDIDEDVWQSIRNALSLYRKPGLA